MSELRTWNSLSESRGRSSHLWGGVPDPRAILGEMLRLNIPLSALGMGQECLLRITRWAWQHKRKVNHPVSSVSPGHQGADLALASLGPALQRAGPASIPLWVRDGDRGWGLRKGRGISMPSQENKLSFHSPPFPPVVCNLCNHDSHFSLPQRTV